MRPNQPASTYFTNSGQGRYLVSATLGNWGLYYFLDAVPLHLSIQREKSNILSTIVPEGHLGNLRLKHTILATTLPVVTMVGLLLGIPAPAGGIEHPPLKDFLKEKFELYTPPVPAPQTGFTDGSGRSVSLGAFKGKVVLLNFWATWCPPCVWEMPKLDSLQARLRGEGLAVVTVSVDREGYPVVKPFLKRHGLVHLKAYLDPNYTLKRHFGYGGLPTTVLIDAQGRVVGMMVGSADWESPDAIELVRYYLRRRYAVPENLDSLETADQAEDDFAYDAYQRGDYAAAYWEWLRMAEEGDAEAQYNLGILYDLGQGVAQSMVKAASWYRKSAEQGFTAAQYNLAVSFANGDGVPQNNVLAYALFDLAAADNPEAAEQRDSMARGITAEEIDRAVRLANRAREDDTAMFLGEVLGAALPAEPGPESESAGPSPELIWTVQEALTALGYDTGATDGMIGSRTRAAVRAFQADTELGVDGQVSEQLLRRLQTALD